MVDAVRVDFIRGATTTEMVGVKRVAVRHTFNAPSIATVVLNNGGGERQDLVSRGDTIRIIAFPEVRTTTTSEYVFYGIVSDVDVSFNDFTITAEDSLALLGNEVILVNPTSLNTGCDVASVIKDVIAGSNYSIEVGDIIGQTRVKMSSGLDLVGKTRLSAVQYLMSQVNVTPLRYRIYGHQTKAGIGMERLPNVDATSYTPYIAGRIPRTTAPLDLYPTNIDRVEEDTDLVNMVTVRNSALDIIKTEPSTIPTNPIHRLFDEPSVTDETQASLFARQILNQQGISKIRWIVEALPGRFDLKPGDIIDFASVEGGLVGRQMAFDISWSIGPTGSTMRLEVGRQAPDFVSSIRFAASLTV